MSRRSPRIRARFAATVRVGGRDEVIACATRDISREGCFLETQTPLAPGTQISMAVFDGETGEALEVHGQVARIARDGDEQRGVGVRLERSVPGWDAMVSRYRAGNEGSSPGLQLRLRIIVAGDDDRRRGALALYVTSGWDVRFASDSEGVREALADATVDAVIAEHDLEDTRWSDILAAARDSQPEARRIVRTRLDGRAAPAAGGPGALVHRVVDLDDGLDALLDALTADLGDVHPSPVSPR